MGAEFGAAVGGGEEGVPEVGLEGEGGGGGRRREAGGGEGEESSFHCWGDRERKWREKINGLGSAAPYLTFSVTVVVMKGVLPSFPTYTTSY